MRPRSWRPLYSVTLATLCVGCLGRAVVVTEPTRVVAEQDRVEAPRRLLQWYDNFWRAVEQLNIPVAWTLSETNDERDFANTLLAMERGDDDEADSAVVPLLTSRDTVVRDAARVAYGALLSSQSRWGRLAEYSTSRGGVRAARDAAGVEAWAPAFAEAHTVATFHGDMETVVLARTETGVPVIDVLVNGVRKRFWLDTGSSISILSSSVAAACGVTPSRADTLELLTAVGRIPARPAITRSLRVGPLEITDLPSMIVDTANFSLRSTAAHGAVRLPTTIDGIIGFDIIRRLDLTIDDAKSRVVIRKPRAHAPSRERPRNLFWFGVPIVTLLTERGQPVHFSLDTGAEETYGTRFLVAKTHARAVNAERRAVNGFGGTAREAGIVVPRVRLFVGDVLLRFERVFLYNAQYPTIFALDGTLGSDVGRGGTVRIDMTNGEFDVSP